MSTDISTHPVAPALFPRTRQAVLELLLSHPDQQYYLREIVGLTGLGVGQVQRELRVLTDAGILRRESRGVHVYFQADSTCPVFAELRSIVTKTLGAGARMSRVLEGVTGIDVAFIYGSVASASETAASDIDVMVIGSAPFRTIVTALKPLEHELKREINPTVYPADELHEKYSAGHHFIREVVAGPKHYLIGTDHDLGEILGQ